jgi:uncharacterized protein
MKRTDREITDIVEIESILNESMVCRIGLAEGSEPYIIPVCFGYVPGIICIHSSMSGKKIAIIEKNPKICFEVDQCIQSFRIRFRVHGECTTEALSDLEKRLS